MPQDDPPPPLSENVVKLLSALADEFERMLTPIVEASFDGVAEVAFAQGTMGAHEVREAVVPPSTGHHLQVCLNVLQDSLRGTVTVEMLNAEGTVLRTERAEVELPQGEARTPRRRPRPLGVISLLFPVHADVDWGAVVSARLSWSPRSSG
jgi:hypothetical protein